MSNYWSDYTKRTLAGKAQDSSIKTIKNLTTSGSVPIYLAEGELASNIPDGLLWIGNSLNNPISLGGGGGGGAADANTLTGTTLASNVVLSSLTTVGTLTGLTVSADIYVNTTVRVGRGNSSVVGNTVVGTTALNANTTGVRNSAFGLSSMNAMLTGTDCTAIGFEALKVSTSPNFTTAVGSLALTSLVASSTGTDGYCTAVGYGAMQLHTLGRYSTAVGALALKSSTAASNTAVGYKAGFATTSGTTNVYAGFQAAQATTTGTNNIAMGASALLVMVAGNSNIAIGSDTLSAMTGVSGNVAIGHQASFTCVSGATNNVAIGYQALRSHLTGSDNVVIGYNAAASGASAAISTSVIIGAAAAQNSTGIDSCVFIGDSAGRNCTTGDLNVAIGSNCLGTGTLTGSGNTCMGYFAAYNTSGAASDNTLIGKHAGIRITGNQNTSVGSGASVGSDISAGSAISSTTGSNNTQIGYFATGSAKTISNEITLGNASIATLRCQVTSITALSDARDKKDVVPLQYGLGFINLLRPVAFTWDCRDGSKVGQTSSGFIAQEVLATQESQGAEAALNLVYQSNPDKLELSAGHLLPVLVKAIQELSAQVKDLQDQLTKKQS